MFEVVMAINGEKPVRRGRGKGYDATAAAVAWGVVGRGWTATIVPLGPMRIDVAREAVGASAAAIDAAQNRARPVRVGRK